mmetsp:Transcript_16208/g.37293  ORF Transcript_16208/g.37293 Transcript_16208/m.37293 type:complete len:555 (-) Transcript_16208:27-1691(-)
MVAGGREELPGSRGDGVDVAFSDDRFFQNVLEAAQQSKASPSAIKRILDLGFSKEAAQIALHVSHGDVEQAAQLCLSGLCYLGAGRAIYETCPGEGSMGPKVLKCYICGQRYLTEKSLEIHLKSCRSTFLKREATRPQHLRRSLIEASELPGEFESLQSFYEMVEAGTPPPKHKSKESATPPFEAWLAPSEGDLSPCRFCSRTFVPARLRKHEAVCLERPKLDPSTIASPKKSAASTPSGPPPAAARAYASFCHGLLACEHCGRQFRRELLPAHTATCGSSAQKPRPMAKRSAQRLGRSRSGVEMGATPSTWSTGNASTPTSQRTSMPTASKAELLKPRVGANIRAAVHQSVQPSAEDASPLSASILASRGMLTAASDEETSSLRAEVARVLPEAEFKGAFRVPENAQGSIFCAMRTSMLAEWEGGEAALERLLWHGTTWSTLPNILRHGFNRSFAGRHGTLLGHGTYFSADLAYSKRFCDRHGGGMDATKVVVLARVLVGHFCKGSRTDVEPPIQDEMTGTRFHSTVDSEDVPRTFVVFRDFQALPEFVVEFS